MDHEELRSLPIKKLWQLFEENDGVDQGEVGVVLASKLAKSRNQVESIAVAEKVVKIGETLANNYFVAEGYFWIGWSNYSLRRFDESYEAYKTCVGYYMQDGLEQSAATGIGNAIDGLLEMDKTQDAYEFSLEGLNLARKVNATREIGYLGRQFIRACRALNRLQEVIDVAPEIIHAWNQLNDSDEVVRVRDSYADCLYDVGELDLALELFRENEKVARVLEMRGYEAYAILKQARIHLDKGEKQRGLQIAERALEFCLERKLLWYAALAHYYIAESGIKSRIESLEHVDEAIALITTTSGADSSLYADLLTLKINMTQYFTEYADECYSALFDLYSWSSASADRIRQKAFVEVRMFEKYLDDGLQEDADEMYAQVQNTLKEFESGEHNDFLFIRFGATELQLLLSQQKFNEVIEHGFEYLQEYQQHRTYDIQIPIAYETIGDAFHALGDDRALEMWRNAVILFSHMDASIWAKDVAGKLLDTVKVPGQLL
ncbi:MAG: hypothetical protein ACO3BI_05060 [Candidatus Nanopelagicales bacterium]